MTFDDCFFALGATWGEVFSMVTARWRFWPNVIAEGIGSCFTKLAKHIRTEQAYSFLQVIYARANWSRNITRLNHRTAITVSAYLYNTEDFQLIIRKQNFSYITRKLKFSTDHKKTKFQLITRKLRFSADHKQKKFQFITRMLSFSADHKNIITLSAYHKNTCSFSLPYLKKHNFR